jgi:UDP:flavonoid glycosyltransferase YjiC (YdhE family)
VARFLLIPHAPGGTLAHLTACVSVAAALRERGHEAVLAYGGSRPELLDEAALEWRRVREAGGAFSTEWFDSDEELDRILASHLEAIEEVGPDVCITSAGAGRLAVAVSGRRHLALMQGLGNSTFGRRGRRREAILGDLRRPSRGLKDLWLSRPMRRSPSALIWLRGWQRHTGTRLDSVTKWTGPADVVACITTPLLDPAPGMPPRWSYVGPLSYAPPRSAAAPGRDSRPDQAKSPTEEHRRVYVSQGSTGDPNQLRRSVAELAAAGFAVIASTGGISDPDELARQGDGVEAAEVHDTRAELEAADVGVIAGGHMTAMEALRGGTPTVVVPRTPSQALAAKRAERLGTGIGLWPRVPPGSIARAASRLCSRSRYRARAAEIAENLRDWNGEANTAALAEALADGAPAG